ncbi:MAG: MarR family transcriptional regulator [Candidatus Bathyarchaeia archaeon]
MSGQVMNELREKIDALLKLRRAPSQFTILFHLLGTGRAMSIKEISGEVGFTAKATERAVAKLLEKGLIQRTPFRDGSYTCDSKQILQSLLLMASDMHDRLERLTGT